MEPMHQSAILLTSLPTNLLKIMFVGPFVQFENEAWKNRSIWDRRGNGEYCGAAWGRNNRMENEATDKTGLGSYLGLMSVDQGPSPRY